MTCGSTEIVFTVSVVMFAVAAFYGSWKNNAIISMLELRHKGIYQALGSPHPLLTADSDRHSVALALFVLSSNHKTIGDSELSSAVKQVRIAIAFNLLSLVLMAVCLLSSSSSGIDALMTWRVPFCAT